MSRRPQPQQPSTIVASSPPPQPSSNAPLPTFAPQRRQQTQPQQHQHQQQQFATANRIHASRHNLLVGDLENELAQLQSEWAAVTEYCAELQQQQHDLSQEISHLELEEKLVTKKLQDILGSSLQAAESAESQNSSNKEKRAPWRTLNVAEREKALDLIFEPNPKKSKTGRNSKRETINGQRRNDVEGTLQDEEEEEDDANAENENYGDEEISDAARAAFDAKVAAQFVFGRSSAAFINISADASRMSNVATSTINDLVDPSRLSVHCAQGVNVANVVNEMSQQAQAALEVAAVLQKQKDSLMAKLNQCAAVSVALEAMLLYRQPSMTSNS